MGGVVVVPAAIAVPYSYWRLMSIYTYVCTYLHAVCRRNVLEFNQLARLKKHRPINLRGWI